VTGGAPPALADGGSALAALAGPAAEVVLAHHPLVTALPFVVPALIVVGLLGAIVHRDRKEEREGR
jgi:hypothetical protein